MRKQLFAILAAVAVAYVVAPQHSPVRTEENKSLKTIATSSVELDEHFVLKANDLTMINDASLPVIGGGPLAHIDYTPYVAVGFTPETVAAARGPTDRQVG